MRCVCWRSHGKVFQTKRNASVRVRKDNFPKNYGLLLDGHIPADPPKDALWLREGRKEEQDGWSQKAPLFITLCIWDGPRGPDVGGFMELDAEGGNRKNIPLTGQESRCIFAGKEEIPLRREELTERHRKSLGLKSVSSTTATKAFPL